MVARKLSMGLTLIGFFTAFHCHKLVKIWWGCKKNFSTEFFDDILPAFSIENFCKHFCIFLACTNFYTWIGRDYNEKSMLYTLESWTIHISNDSNVQQGASNGRDMSHSYWR